MNVKMMMQFKYATQNTAKLKMIGFYEDNHEIIPLSLNGLYSMHLHDENESLLMGVGGWGGTY